MSHATSLASLVLAFTISGGSNGGCGMTPSADAGAYDRPHGGCKRGHHPLTPPPSIPSQLVDARVPWPSL